MKKLLMEPVKSPQRMSSYWKKEWRIVLMIVLTGTLFDTSMSLGPVLQGRIIDSLLAGEHTDTIINSIIIFVGVVSLIQIVRFFKRFYVRTFANRTIASMRKMVYNNLISRDASALNHEKTGDLMTKAVSDVDACVEGMRKFTTEVFDTGVLMISYTVTLMCYDVALTFCACALIPVAMIIAEKLKKVIFKYTKAYRSELSEMSELTYETVENAMLYRVCSVEKTNLARYNAELAQLERKAILSNMLENSMQPIYNVIATTGVFAIVLLGGKNVIAGQWTVGEFSAYLTIFSALAIKAAKAAKLFNSVQKAQVSWKRIKPYLTEFHDDIEPKSTHNSQMSLTIKNMSFTYPDSEISTVNNVSFTAENGMLIGITGPVASGKSTIGLALLGMYDYTGSIRLNSKELRDCKPFEISRNIAYMGHEAQLLSDTIYRNITLGDDGDIMPVLRDVCFECDLASMPNGIKTMVGASGIRLSGGQQARLALARALYQKTPILVLDDPFSAVDVKTERQIIANLKINHANRIIILISHRIACFESADKVVLVDAGNTILGKHNELLQYSEVYRTIVEMQAGGMMEHE